MPAALSKLGKELSAAQISRERALFVKDGVVDRLFVGLDAELKAYLELVWKRISKQGIVQRNLWVRHRANVTGQLLNTPLTNFTRKATRASKRFQRLGYIDTTRRSQNAFKELFPWPTKNISKKQYQDNLNAIDFTAAKLEFKFLQTGREVKEDVNWEQIADQALATATEQTSGVPERINVGTGKRSRDFKFFLAKQLTEGVDPSTQIRTITSQQVASLQRILIRNVTQGFGIRETKKQFVDKVFRGIKDSPERKSFEKNVLRILRTSHNRASSTAASMWSLNNRHVVTGLLRTADGRPCIACVGLDGTTWPVGSPLLEHPGGMCVFTYIIKSPRELIGRDLPEKINRSVGHHTRPFRSMFSKFMAMPESEQRRMFANNALFNLWKKERLPLQALVAKRNGMFVPKSFKEVSQNLGKIGGISNPKAKLAGVKQPDIFLKQVDPADLANPNVTLTQISKLKPVPSELQRFIDNGDLMIQALGSNSDAVRKAKDFIRFHGDKPLDQIPWWDANEFLRSLGVWTRYGPGGKKYFAIPNNVKQVELRL